MKRIIFLIFFIFGTLYSVNASHDAGCDLSYTCLGGNDYLITLSFYRDCSGISEDNTATINFTSSCSNFSIVMQKIAPPNGLEVTPTCPTAVTTCNGGSNYGLRKWVYQGQVTLPPCADWTMSWQMCCRNTSGTIVNSTSAYLYIEAHLNNLIAPCNSSPTFSNPPSTIICSGQQFCFNHGALDPDGDSLVYSLVTPFDRGPGGSPVYVTYNAPYTAQQPLLSTPPVTINPVTGDLCMTPTQNIITVLAVLVQEYRHINGVPTLIGSVLRDMQLNVIPCSNQIPTLGGINPLATQYNIHDSIYAEQVCLGDTVSFNIYAHDPDVPAQNLTMSWNSGIPDGTMNFTGNGSTNPVGHFFWVPAPGTISNVPYCFTVRIQDDNCPYVGMQTFSYCITIQGITVTFGLPQDTLLCKGESLMVIGYGDTNVVNYHWTMDGDTVMPTINDSTYFVNSDSLIIGPHSLALHVDNGILTHCPGSAYINVQVVNLPTVNLGPDDTICSGQAITLNAGPGGTLGGTYHWYPSGDTTQTIQIDSSGTYIVDVDGGHNTRCRATDTVKIKVLHLPHVDLGTDLCIIGNAVLNAQNPGFLYHWNNGDTTQMITTDSAIYYSVTVAEQWGFQCEDTSHINILHQSFIDLGPDLCLIKDTILDAQNDSVYFHYLWSTGDTSRTIHVTQTGTYSVTVFQEQGHGCESSSDISITIIPQPKITLGPDTTICQHESIKLEVTGVGITLSDYNYTYAWWPTLATEPFIVQSMLPEGVHEYVIAVTGCTTVMDTLKLTVKPCPLTVPNVFTPNGDGVNDVFEVKNLEYYPGSKFTVFNRWGKKIYENNDYKNDWNGENFADGVYYFILLVKYPDVGFGEKIEEHHGTVTILR